MSEGDGQSRKRRRVPEGDTSGAGTSNIGMYRRAVPKAKTKTKVSDKRLKAAVKRSDAKARAAAYAAARAEILLPEEAGYLEAEGMEKTYKFTQKELRGAVDVASARKVFDLKLDSFGPYAVRFTRNGRHLLLGGEKGHLGLVDWKTGALRSETFVEDKVRDVTWLHDDTMFATAQSRATYVYDNTGAEVYVLRNHVDPLCLEFLPYHFLLASVGNAGWLKYHDTSIGKLVAEKRTKLGPCNVMRQNPYNAVIHLGHTNGTVTLWTPNMSTYAAKLLCHRGPVRALAVDQGGMYMATAGLDGQMKIWDIRNFKDTPLQAYYNPTPATCLDISQRNMLAVGFGPHVQIWQNPFASKQEAPYLTHMMPKARVKQCRFAQFEDVLGIGHSLGYSSILVPGSGEPNYDALEANPFQTSKQRREAEVKGLLEKIQPELITLNPTEILTVKRVPAVGAAAATATDGDQDDNDETGDKGKRADGEGDADSAPQGPKKARGRNSARRRFLRKQRNVMDDKRLKYKEKMQREADKAKAKARENESDANSDVALRRFRRKLD
eukprot:m.64414 g.64414  ORF g.64414 m.64414 type:complete len:552 (+) comp8223_c0_seq1:251-1906(+)